MWALVLTTCLLLGGALLVVHTRSSPHDSLARTAGKVVAPASSPATSASGSSSGSATGSATGSSSGAHSPGTDQTLTRQVAQRAAELRRLAQKAAALSRKRKHARPVSTFTFVTFNVQGAVHRGRVGQRTALARDLLARYDADVVALQEFERPQRAVFDRLAGGTYQVYPGNTGRSIDGENSIAWRRDRFELVSGETRPYPYFKGAIRNMPRVLLRDKKTGTQFYVTSYHNPASCCHYGNQTRFRATAVSRQIADANALRAATRRPLIVAGDMNDRATYFCRMAGATGMHSADGSRYAGGCRVASRLWIDWVMGTSDVTFSGYLRDRGPADRSASDHPVVVTQVRVTGRAGDGVDAGMPLVPDVIPSP